MMNHLESKKTGGLFGILPTMAACLTLAALVAAPTFAWAALSVTSLFPANGATGQCVDTHLQITFDSAPVIGVAGTVNIYRASDSALIDTLDVSPTTSTRRFGGTQFIYYPVMVRGNTAIVIPHNPTAGTSSILEYGVEYYVNVDSGAFRDGGGTPWPGISDTATWRFTIKPSAPAQNVDLVVSTDGTGDFCTLQGAADRVPASNTTARLITMTNGTYDEIVYVSNKHNVTVHGESRAGTVIAYPNNAILNPSGRHMIRLYNSNDWTIENLTMHNTTPDGGSQAEALRSDGYRTKVLGCDLKSHQDTLYYGKQTYYSECYIEGDTDFVWGPGVGYFEDCEIKALDAGYNCWARNGQTTYGTVFTDCELTRLGSLTGHYLARTGTGYEYSHVAYVNCKMDAHIDSEGWPSDSPSTVRFWEYQSTDLVGTPLNVSGRNPVSRQITDAEAAQMRDHSCVFGTAHPWDPIPGRPAPAAGPSPANGSTYFLFASDAVLSWTPGDGATSHTVYFASTDPPSLLTTTTETEIHAGALQTDTTYYWRVDETNAGGTKTGTPWTFRTKTELAASRDWQAFSY